MYADPELITRMFSPEDLESHRPMWTDPPDQGEVVAEWTRRDGRCIWIEHRFVVTRDAAGRPLVFEGIIRDITTRKGLDRFDELPAEHVRTMAG